MDCTHCGTRIDLPAGHTRPKIRCTLCGYYVEVPESQRSTSPPFQGGARGGSDPRGMNETESEDSPSPAASLEGRGGKTRKSKKVAAPLIAGTTDEDDNPYTVPGDPVQTCPACRKEIDIDATFCTLCGVDLASGKKAKKAYQPIDRSWEPRWNYDLRFKFFAGLCLFNGVLVTINVLFRDGSFFGGFLFVVLQTGLQAFLLGTYEKITVQRTGKGVATLWTTWRFAFIPKPRKKIDWKASQGVGIIAFHQPGVLEWMTFIYLLLCGILPGILFWLIVMRPDRFHISLCDVYGSTNDIAFRTTDREQAEEICRTINDATGLWYKPVL